VTQNALVYPMLVQVGLTFALLFWMARERYVAIKTRVVRPAQIALGEPGWPITATKVANSFRNQLEVPILFYLLVVLAIQTRMIDGVLVALAWVFVSTRLAHAAVHTTCNDVMVRGSVFGVGVLVLFAMWIWLAARLLGGA
jgi:hypothetical protein